MNARETEIVKAAVLKIARASFVGSRPSKPEKNVPTVEKSDSGQSSSGQDQRRLGRSLRSTGPLNDVIGQNNEARLVQDRTLNVALSPGSHAFGRVLGSGPSSESRVNKGKPKLRRSRPAAKPTPSSTPAPAVPPPTPEGRLAALRAEVATSAPTQITGTGLGASGTGIKGIGAFPRPSQPPEFLTSVSRFFGI